MAEALLYQGDTPTTTTNVYSVPNGSKGVLTYIDINNTTASPVLVTVYTAKSQTIFSASNIILNVTVPGDGFIQWSGRHNMASNMTIYAKAAASGVTITINGEVA